MISIACPMRQRFVETTSYSPSSWFIYLLLQQNYSVFFTILYLHQNQIRCNSISSILRLWKRRWGCRMSCYGSLGLHLMTVVLKVSLFLAHYSICGKVCDTAIPLLVGCNSTGIRIIWQLIFSVCSWQVLK